MTLPLRSRGLVVLSLVVGACTTAPTPPASPNQAVAPATATAALDPRVQQIAREELERAATEWHAVTGAVVVLDLRTGAILAMAGTDRGRD
ncbi:MAG: hypothetical protein K0S65_1919, partial [Labilithrix sp.]|nr:hypothetical protein [Labilithrix sp.]